MIVINFPHPSRPGFHSVTFDEQLRLDLDRIAAAMLPGGGAYPSGQDAGVSRFIEARASADDRDRLGRLINKYIRVEDRSAASGLSKMEQGDPSTFGWLRELIYHAYYSSHRTLAAMAEDGYAYHGAPQPLGYQITEDPMLPIAGRGSYRRTDQVQHVF